MIIETTDGRHRSQITKDEKIKNIKDRWNTLSEEEKSSFRVVMDELSYLSEESEFGYENLEEIRSCSSYFHGLSDAHYVERIVSVDEFILDKHYLGHVGSYFYDKWREDLNELFSGEYTEAIITGSLGSGKCLDGKTEFYDPSKGCRFVLEEVCGEDDVYVVAFDKEQNKTVSKKAEVRLSGEKRLGTLILSSGKKIRLSQDHPILTADGWTPVGELGVGDLVATARSVPEPEVCYDISDEEVEFVAFMLTDGACSSGNWSFTKGSDSCLRRFVDVTSSLWWRQNTMSPKKRGVSVKEKDAGKMTLYPRGTRWIQRKYGLYQTSHGKRVPPEFFGLSDRKLGLFLNRVWSCDGNINYRDRNTFEISLASEMFVRDIQQLLLRFGIHSRMKKRRVSYQYKGEKRWSWSWRLTVSGVDNLEPFCNAIGSHLGKEEAWEEVNEWVKANKGRGNTNVDVTPVTTEESKQLRSDLGVSVKDWTSNRVTKGQRMGHAKLVSIEEMASLPEWCDWWTGVFWDKVVFFKLDDEVSPVYDVEVPGPKNFAPGGIIVHNTTFCDMGLAYMFYELCMLKDPQATFGLMPGSEIVLVCFNRDKKLARDVTFGGLKRKLEVSPFFKELGVKFGNSEMVYEKKNIRVIAVSVRSADAMGRDVFGGIIDETDFMEGSILKKSVGTGTPGNRPFAELLHESITRRMKSRYDRAGVLPGKLFLSSSARHKTSFTNKRIGEASNESHVFCRDYAIYDVAPPERFSKRRFWVLVGTERIRHRILTKTQYRAIKKPERDKLIEQGCKFIRVPQNFRPDFESNIEDAIRDIAGVVTVALSPFIQMRDKIYESIDPTLFHPLSELTWSTDEMPYIDWNKLVRRYERRVGPGRKVEEIRPRRHPFAPRHVHFDLSLGAQDPAGMCIAHVVDTIKVERRTDQGDPILDEAPLIEVDLILRIDPPRNGEINFAAVRGIVYDFMRHGYIISFASADSFQSHDTIQQMEAQGVDGEIVSVDKTMEPYTVLKTAFYEGRISVYEYPILLEELVQLQRDEVKRKVDHPQNGCFVGNTRVSLINGMTPMISEMTEKESLVYSCDSAGVVVVGKARGRWTKDVTKLVEVFLANGEIERCTPEHRWMLSDGTYKQAQDLEPGRDVLMSMFGPYCRVVDVELLEFDLPVPVYDLEVDQFHNFALQSGVFVHNSKDCSDSLAGVTYTLSKHVSYQAPLMMGESETIKPDADSEWIRQTMSKSGDKSPVKVGSVDSRGKPIVFSG